MDISVHGQPLFPQFGAETRSLIDRVPALVEELFPLPRRFRAGLPRDVAELSALLTFDQSGRIGAYLGKAPLLSAYLRYFLPWNVYRLCRLLPALPLNLNHGDRILDLGSGPLTLPIALWIARPEFRSLRLELRCTDQTGAALEAGKKLFDALSAGTSPWTIRLIRAPLGGAETRGAKAALVSAVNLFTEVFQHTPRAETGGLAGFAEKSARLIASLTVDSGSALVLEPGVPRSGAFIDKLRAALLERGYTPAAPCPHNGPCPFAAAGKWCHFAFDAHGAPQSLARLSAAAGIPKKRAVLSFLAAGKTSAPPEGFTVRVISDAFPTGSSVYGRYACSSRGLVLLTGSRDALEQRPSGVLLDLDEPRPPFLRDQKSRALVLKV
jgi:hypothetical protein